jgi:hypothetical protein
MSYDFDVFVSYARADGSAFVADLVGRLKSAGLRVWYDLEQMRGGSIVNEALADGLRKSRHAIFVLTRAWLQNEYTTWELEVFREQDKDRRRVPVTLIGAPRKEELGPRLHGINWIEWPAKADPDERFWLVYCGLLDLAPGDGAQWKAKGLEAQAKSGLLGTASLPLLQRDESTAAVVIEVEAADVFGCDRDPQWGVLSKHAARKNSEVIFVVGELRQAHDAFLARIQHCLPKDPPRRIVSVRWDPPYTPIGRGQFVAALQRAFDCRNEAQLVAELRAQLTDQNVLLVHRPIAQDAFDRDDLVSYYTKWLPELVQQADPDALADDRIFGLKAIQAVAWEPGSILGGLRSLMPWRTQRASADAKASEQAAEDLLASVKNAAHPLMPIVLLDELHDITEEDVARWSETLPGRYDRGKIVAQVMTGARDSAAILEKIANLFANDRRPDP